MGVLVIVGLLSSFLSSLATGLDYQWVATPPSVTVQEHSSLNCVQTTLCPLASACLLPTHLFYSQPVWKGTGPTSWSPRYNFGRVSEPSFRGYLSVPEFRCSWVYFCSQSRDSLVPCFMEKQINLLKDCDVVISKDEGDNLKVSWTDGWVVSPCLTPF